jgi:hypothetical protein
MAETFRPQSDKSTGNSDKSEKNGLERFGDGLGTAVEAPVLGLLQIAGKDIGKTNTGGDSAETVGSLVGSGVLFTATTAAMKYIPGIGGKLAGATTGAVLGFLSPTSENQGLGTRLGNAALGAGAVLGLTYGPKGMAALSDALPFQSMAVQERSSLSGSLLSGMPRALSPSLKQTALSAGLVGAGYTQLDSLIKTGDFASTKDTLAGAISWGLLSGGAHAVGEVFKGGSAKPVADTPSNGEQPTPKPENQAKPESPEATLQSARDSNNVWTHATYQAGYKNVPLLQEGMILKHPEEITSFVQRYSRLDKDALTNIRQLVDAGGQRQASRLVAVSTS